MFPCAVFRFPGRWRRATTRRDSLLTGEAASRGVALSEFQLNLDCAQKKLAGYRSWVVAVRDAIGFAPLAFTARPAWLAEQEAGLAALQSELSLP